MRSSSLNLLSLIFLLCGFACTKVDNEPSSYLLIRASSEEEMRDIIDWRSSMIKEKPLHISNYLHRGYAYLKLNETENALKDFEIAIKIDSLNAEACLGRGIALQDLDAQQALADLDRSLKMDDQNGLTYFHRAKINYLLSRDNEAHLDFEQAIKLIPDYPLNYIVRGWFYWNLDSTKEAIQDLEHAEILGDTSSLLYWSMGFFNFENRNYKKAISALTNMIRNDPTVTDGYLFRAMSYDSLSMLSHAAADFETALNLNPPDTSLVDYLIRCYVRLERFDDAVEYIEKFQLQDKIVYYENDSLFNKFIQTEKYKRFRETKRK